MAGLVSVTVAGPCKIGAAWHKPGDVVEVTPVQQDELAEAGVILIEPGVPLALDAPQVLTFTPAEWRDAVQAEARKIVEAGDVRIAELAQDNVRLTAECDALRAQVASLTGALSQAKSDKIEAAQIAAAISGAGGKGEIAPPVPAPATGKSRAPKG